MAHPAGDGVVASTRTPHSIEVVPTSFTEASEDEHVADVHRLEERHLVDRDRDGEPAPRAGSPRARRGVDQAHHDASVHGAGDVDVGDLHQLGELDARVGDRLGGEGSSDMARIVRRAAVSTMRPRVASADATRRLPSAIVIVLCLVACSGCGAGDRARPVTTTREPRVGRRRRHRAPAVSPRRASRRAPPRPRSPPACRPATTRTWPPASVPVDELIPPGDEVTAVDRARTDAGEAVVVAFATPGADPFRQARGFRGLAARRRRRPAVAGRRTASRTARGDGVLAISADATDLTGDGVGRRPDPRGDRRQRRLRDLPGHRPRRRPRVWKRAVCDAEIQPNPDPIGLYEVDPRLRAGGSALLPQRDQGTRARVRTATGSWSVSEESTTL